MADEKVKQSAGAVRERGTQYPGDNLEAGVSMLERIRGALGFNAVDRKSALEALGYKSESGTANRKIGTLTHFGLLERAGKGAVKISALGQRVLVPTSDGERAAAIAEAAAQPNLYRRLLKSHAGNAVPSMLPNLLVREHGVAPSVAADAAKTFRESMEFAGLLRNGVLYESHGGGDEPAPEEEVTSRKQTESQVSPAVAATAPDAAGTTTHTIVLNSTGRKATITMPTPMTKTDLRKARAWIDYLEGVIDDEPSKETLDISAT